MIQIIVVYDIADDRVRYRVSESCLDYGLDREQFSVFSGRLQDTHIRELTKHFQATVKDGQVQVIRVSRDDWDRRVIIGSRDT